MNSPIDIPTDHTVTFIESHIPRGGSILEIGCGIGHVAAKLASRDYDVLGIDANEESVSQARKLGANVVYAVWPTADLNAGGMDAVVFTRSLHHISPLPEAVAGVIGVLRPGGSVLVEDFSFGEADPAAIRWFRKVIGSPDAQKLISTTSDNFLTELLNADDPVEAWHRDHDHELHSIAAMTRAMEEKFLVHATSRVPYLYRYLVDVLPRNCIAASFVRQVFEEESQLAEEGRFAAIGYRIVAVTR